MTIDSPYRLREALEDKDKSQTGGIRKVLADAGMDVYTRINAVGDWYKKTPRCELKVEIGGATGHRFVCPDGVLRYDFFNFALAIQAVTRPKNKSDDNEQHETFCATIRGAISKLGGNASALDTDNFPQVIIAEFLRDVGTTDHLKESDGIEYSTMAYAGIVMIRQTAWDN